MINTTPRTEPTFYFIGVTTAKSSIMKIFPRWIEALGFPDVVIEGIDHPLHDDPEAYHRTVSFIKNDPKSVGGLVTTHKIDLLKASRDLFDELHESAQLTGEVSCIAKRDGKLMGFAKDPVTSGLSLGAVLGDNYFGRTGGHVLCFGAGGAGKAIALHLMQQANAGDRPEKMIITNLTRPNLDALAEIAGTLKTDIDFEFVENGDPAMGDQLMASLPLGSVVINATGMGKDIPGSPITDAGVFPQDGVAWEINYRGELDFWHQAMAQREARNLTVEDGWLYFLHGWTQVVAEVMNVPLDRATFARLCELAEDYHPPLTHG